MLFARSHRFGLDIPWYLHCRLDSSPQYGKDYFMAECDIFYPTKVQPVKTWKDVAVPGVIHTRLLVGQTLGARASGVIVKTQKLLHQLALDPCHNPN